MSFVSSMSERMETDEGSDARSSDRVSLMMRCMRQGDRFKRAFAAERQYLADKVFGALSRFEYLDKIVFKGCAARSQLFRQLRIAENDAEDIVEIMGDAAGKRADGFHLLRLAQLFFKFFSVGDIAA